MSARIRPPALLYTSTSRVCPFAVGLALLVAPQVHADPPWTGTVQFHSSKARETKLVGAELCGIVLEIFALALTPPLRTEAAAVLTLDGEPIPGSLVAVSDPVTFEDAPVDPSWDWAHLTIPGLTLPDGDGIAVCARTDSDNTSLPIMVESGAAVGYVSVLDGRNPTVGTSDPTTVRPRPR